MKITVWFAVAGAALGIQGVASAADIAKARPAPAYNPCSNARFSGAYLGGNAGAIAYAATRSDRDQYFVSTYEYSLSAIGPTVGVQAGYDWQSCNKVLGIVADWNWTDAEAHRQIVPNLISGDIHSKMDWFSTIRARAGLAVNDTLFYVTGGVAAAHVSSAVSTSQQHFAFNSVRWGLVGGAGAEFSLGNNWSLNAESLYMRFAKDTNTLISPVRGALSFENNDSAWVNRVGLNYRFGNPQNAYASASSRVATSPDPCGPSRFGGGYVGGNLGMVSATARRGDHDLYFLAGNGAEQSASANSFTAGAQAGWDWRSCNTLLGVVADWNWANADTQMPVRFRSSSFGDMNTGMDWFATVRGRAGLVVDNTLVYVTGGVAAASIGTIGLARFTDPDIEESFAFGKTRLGLVGGVGAEFALAGNWSMNTELLYMQFSKSTDTFNSVNSPQPGITGFESHDSAWVSRAGLNYRWGNPGVAKASATTSCGPARFAGGYVGGNVGAIHHTAVNRDQDAYISFPAEYTSTTGAVTAGVQTGYDWQSCARVFGVVADWNWTNANSIARTFPNGIGISPLDTSIQNDLNWYGTARARAGLAVNDVLVYVTGGLAFASTDSKVVNIVGPDNEQFMSGHTRWGWAGGAGTEFALANNWSVNGEVLYMQFAKSTDTFISPAQNNVAFGFVRDDSAWVGRVGVNYRWGTSTN